MFERFVNEKQSHGRFIHVPYTSASGDGYAIAGERSGTVLCKLRNLGEFKITEWDSFFVAAALNYALIEATIESMLVCVPRRDGWNAFFSDFPSSFDPSAPEFNHDSGELVLKGAGTEHAIRLHLEVPKSVWTDAANYIQKSVIDFYDAVKTALPSP